PPASVDALPAALLQQRAVRRGGRRAARRCDRGRRSGARGGAAPGEECMSLQDAFLADIIADPDDDAVRLIYADWLMEHDQPERGEFIRLQIAGTGSQARNQRLTLDVRERQLLAQREEEWVGELREFVVACEFHRGL